MMGFSVTDLPEQYQRQVLDKLKQEHGKQISRKYHNQPTEVSGIKFDSKKEAARFPVLLAEQNAGLIDDLRLQVEFVLVGAYTTPDGVRHRALKYYADFTYLEDGELIVEDTKGKRTQTFIDKKKLMREKYGIEIQET